MTMNDNEDRDTEPVKADAVLYPEVPDPDPVTLIQVSVADDGTLSVDVDPAVVAPGGTVVWRCPTDGQRSFRVTLKPASDPPARVGVKGSGGAIASGEMSQQSRLEQIVGIRISSDAMHGMWECAIDTDGVQQNPNRLFSGIIVRPPKK